MAALIAGSSTRTGMVQSCSELRNPSTREPFFAGGISMIGNLLNRPVAKRTATRGRRVCLQVEPLEDRTVPAVLTVGPGKMFATVGAAAAAANSGDTIRID